MNGVASPFVSAVACHASLLSGRASRGRSRPLPESPTSLLTASENDSALVFVGAPANWLASRGAQDFSNQVFETIHDCGE